MKKQKLHTIPLFLRKEGILLFFSLFYITYANAQHTWTGFVSEWNTGSSNSITIPLHNISGNIDVYWEKIGNPTTNGTLTDQSGNVVISSLDMNTDYKIDVTGTSPAGTVYIYFNNSGDKDKIKNITQWGNVKWRSFLSSFSGCSNLDVTANDKPDASGVTNLGNIFANCTSLKGETANWDWGDETKNITSLSNAFNGCKLFNPSSLSWNTGKVTGINGMFQNCKKFNADISDWNISAVTNMNAMFFQASSFNRDIDTWDISHVSTMTSFLQNATSFNQYLGDWIFNASGVTMTNAFSNTGMDCNSYSNTLNGWAKNVTSQPNNLIIDAQGSHYYDITSITNARSTLMNIWTINDAGSTITCAGFVLPIKLLYFNATKRGPSAILSWATSTESDNQGFEVERSNDGTNWKVIGHVATKAADGNSSIELTYQFEDNEPLTGINYYRLKQNDLGGKSVYSLIEIAQFNVGNHIIVFPNPTTDILKIAGLQGGELVQIFDASGKLLSSSANGSGSTFTKHLAQWVSGIYIIRITDVHKQITTIRIVKE